jgi:hypothetical protein
MINSKILIEKGDFSPKSIAKCIQSSDDIEQRRETARCIIGGYVEWVQEHSLERLFEAKRRKRIKHTAWRLMWLGYDSPLLWAPLGPLSLLDFCWQAVNNAKMFADDECPF